MNLNESQQKAVTCLLKPTLVIAGPGSGKTHVIINRVHYMINKLGCAPHHILVVTFSKLAAEEMKQRYENNYGATGVTFGTLHSVFYRILRRSNPKRYAIESLLLEDKKKSILQNLAKELELTEEEDFIDQFIKHQSLMQNQLITEQNYYPEGISRDAFIKLLKKYRDFKERHQLFDFDDMLIDCYYLLENDATIAKAISYQYQYILIDEFQDINEVQFRIIKKICSTNGQIFVVGDDDQSIYQFRGAKPEFLLDFKKHFTESEEIYLNINYRSSQNILKYSLALIEHNTTRYQKILTTPNPKGDLPIHVKCKDAKEEALFIINEIINYKNSGVSLKDMAIIYRTNLQARPIVEGLLAASIPFCLRDGMVSLYDQWITQDLLAYLYLADNINQPDLVRRIINKPKRYISQATLEQTKQLEGHFFMNLLSVESLTEWQKNYIHQLLFDLQVLKEKDLKAAITYIRKNIGYDSYVLDYAAFRNMPATNLLEVLDDIEDSAESYSSFKEWEVMLKTMSEEIKDQSKSKTQDAINLTTMHGSKGLEFNTVFIIGAVDGIVPHHKSQSPCAIEEERRLLYVAMTRAKKNLLIYSPGTYHGKNVEISPFLEEIQMKLAQPKLKIGQILYHKTLGKGIITQLLEGSIILVQFNNGQLRKIDSHYTIKNGIINLEDEVDEKTT